MKGIIDMLYGKIMKVAGLAAMAIGFTTSAHAQAAPYQFYQEENAVNYGDEALFWHFDLDFTKTSANSALDFQTFANPRSGSTVRYYPLRITAGVSPGGCYDITSGGAAGADPIISAQNQIGTWKWIGDDNYGSGQFHVRVYIKPSASYELRISQYTNSNANDQLQIYVKKIKADAGSTINGVQSCRQTGVPYWQYDLNSGDPYNPS